MQPQNLIRLGVRCLGVMAFLSAAPGALAQTCNWWGTEYPVCQTTTKGWGWENNASCISVETCSGQPAPFGVVGSVASSSKQSSSTPEPSSSSVVSSAPASSAGTTENCTDMCKWYQDAPRPLCLNQARGWGWENNLSCIGPETCSAQTGDGGIIAVCEAGASSSSKKSSSSLVKSSSSRVSSLSSSILSSSSKSSSSRSSVRSSSSRSSVAPASSSAASISAQPTFFSNPFFGNGADPWMQWYEGNYYLVTTTWTSQLVMRKSPTLEGLKTAAPVYIWSDTNADRCCNFWAFEFHRLNGPNGYRWYLMFTAGHDANLDRQHLVVLESERDDPMGPYRLAGEPMQKRWNIDGSYLQHNGRLYLLWSEWDGPLQKNWIQRLSNPWTVTGSRVELTAPQYDWERQPGLDNAGLVTEAPEILQHNGRTFLTYSASSCNGPDYKLGMLELVGSDPLNPRSWYKFPQPVFQRANGAYGTGHNGFFKSPDGSEDWLVYHANSRADQGCGSSRSTRAQVIRWNSDGTPNFGMPVREGQVLAAPSGESGPLKAKVQGAPMHLVNENSEYCLTTSGSNVVQSSCSGKRAEWVLDATNDGYYRLANADSGQFLQLAGCGGANGVNAEQGDWVNAQCQKWKLESVDGGWLQLANAQSGRYLDVANCTASDGGNVQQWAGLDNACQHWQLKPARQAAIVSAQSGKALDVPYCNTDLGINIQQYEWLSSACQKWIFEDAGQGYVKIKPTTNTSACLAYESGNNLIQGSCSNTASDFYLVPLDDGAVSLRARDNGEAMDVDSCKIDNAANIQLYRWLDNTCQRFYLRDVNQEQVSVVTPTPPINDTVTPSTWNLSGNLGTHDPSIIEENGVWWQFQTGKGIYGKRSNDGRNWDPLPSIFSNDLSWWKNYVPDHANNDVWAPDVHRFNGRTWIYYSISTFGSRVSAIGLTSATSIAAGDWRDDGLVISSNNSNSYNAIDANLVITPAGDPWMVFGSWNDGIMLTEINPSTMKPTGRLYNIARKGGGIEGPTLIHRNGYYYLFVSVGRCCAGVDSTYRILVGRSSSITGPYLDRSGNNMLSGAGTVVKESAGNWIGPGGQDIHDGVIAYHAYDANRNGSPFLRIETLGWGSDGWPYLR